MNRAALYFIVAASLTLAAQLGFLIARWDTLSDPVKGALVGGTITLLTAILGLAVVGWQLHRQGENTIKGNRHNEVLKLRKDLYSEVLKVYEKSTKDHSKLNSYVRGFASDLALQDIFRQQALSASTPRHRIGELIERSDVAARAITRIISLTEKWEIVEPRLSELFRAAFHIAAQERREAWQPYFDMCVRGMMPHESNGTLQPWAVPPKQFIDDLKVKADSLCDALQKEGSFMLDYMHEMQNLLLGELFETRVPSRKPIDPQYMAIELARYDELMKYFDQHKHWGVAIRETEAKVKEALATDPRP